MKVKSVAEKARVKPGTAIAMLNSVPSVVDSLRLPKDVTFERRTEDGRRDAGTGDSADRDRAFSMTSSNSTAATAAPGEPVSITGRTSARAVTSGSFEKFLSGSPSNASSVAKYNCVESDLKPAAVTKYCTCRATRAE